MGKKFVTDNNINYIINKMNSSFSPIGHNHDDRYYTESEINSKLTFDLGTITSNESIDDYKEIGFAWMEKNAGGTRPFDDYCLIEISKIGTAVVQRATSYGANVIGSNVKTRMFVNGEWGAWRHIGLMLETIYITGDGTNTCYIPAKEGYNLISVRNQNWEAGPFTVTGINVHFNQYLITFDKAFSTGLQLQLIWC